MHYGVNFPTVRERRLLDQRPTVPLDDYIPGTSVLVIDNSQRVGPHYSVRSRKSASHLFQVFA